METITSIINQTLATMETKRPKQGDVAKRILTDKQKAAQKKREWLRNLSNQLSVEREIAKMMEIDVPTINELLIDYYKQNNGVTELHTYDDWKKQGYQVKAGEKAFLIWGSKVQIKPDENIETQTQNQDEQTQKELKSYFPLCYLFDITQVFHVENCK